MLRSYKVLSGLFLLTLLLAVPLRCGAQETGTITGTAVDSSGAVLPNVSVVATNVATGVRRETTTGAQGTFTLVSLPPGTYNIEARAGGFRVEQVRDIVLHARDQLTLTLTMQIGVTGETITVTADAAHVNTESATVATTVDRQFVENMPLNGRSIQSLLLLTPGITPVVNIQGTNSGGSFAVNGMRPASNGFSVDGVNANFAASPGSFNNFQTSGNLPGFSVLGTTQTLASVDAIQEFKVQTSTYNAEFGPQPGAQVSIVTRGGTNTFHGSAFDYLRNDVLDANDWFADRLKTPKPPERQSDFGGTLGGPVWIPGLYSGKDKTFFFFSYEGLRLRLPQFVGSNVPSLCIRGMGSCLPTVAGVVDKPAVAAMLPILNAFPLPNGIAEKQPNGAANGLAEYFLSFSNPSDVDTTSIRVDHNFGPRLSVFARYNNSPSDQITRSGSNLAVVSPSGLNTWTFTAGATATFTPQLTNDFRINYSSNQTFGTSTQTTLGGAVPVARGALIPSDLDNKPTQANAVLSGLPGATQLLFPSLSAPGLIDASNYQFNVNDTLSWVVGTHQLKFGGSYRHSTPAAANNAYLFIGQFTSLAGIQNGTAALSIQQSNLPSYPIFDQYAWFAQDTWKVTHRLTLNYGLRWDYLPPPGERNDHFGAAPTQITNLSTLKLAATGTPEWNAPQANFAPRFGAAYQLRQSAGHETVLRGGFGLFYDTGNDRSTQNSGRYPWAFQRTIANLSYPLNSALIQPTALPLTVAPPYPTGLTMFDPNLKLPYSWQWNAAVEQALGADQKLSVSYVASAGRKLLQAVTTPMASAPISNPNFAAGATIQLTTNHSTSDYDSLQVQFQRRLSHGLQALASYTWSHALDDDSDSNTGRVAKRGNAAFDVRHILSTAITYDLPKPSNRFARAVFGYWSTDTTFHAQTAPPIDISSATIIDPTTGGTISVRPNVNAGVPWYLHGSACTASNIQTINGVTGPVICPGGVRVNPAAFSNPAAGQSGTLGRNQVRGQGAWQLDYALRREFPIRERLKLQFRAEAFNLFNHPNFGFGSSLNGTISSSQANLTSATFGEPTSMLNRSIGGMNQLYQLGGPRSFQFALKLMF